MGCAARRCTGRSLIDVHDGLRAWIPPEGDSPVRVRTPPEHPGPSIVFVPIVVLTPTAHEAVVASRLIHREFTSVVHTLSEEPETQCSDVH